MQTQLHAGWLNVSCHSQRHSVQSFLNNITAVAASWPVVIAKLGLKGCVSVCIACAYVWLPQVPVFGVAGLLYKRCMRNSLCQPIMCQTLRSQFTAWQRALSASQEQTQLVQQQRDWAYNESAQSQASLTECRNELSYYTSMPSMPQLTYMTQQVCVCVWALMV